MTGYRYARPDTVEEAVALLERYAGEAHVLAGGTALALLMKQSLIEPGVLVDLGAIPRLREVRVNADGGLVVGAMGSLRAIERDPGVMQRAPAFASTLARVATVRIRNQATLGGNLAHADPAQDPPPMLLVLDAAVEVQGPAGARRIPLDQFFVDVFETVLAPAEVITAVHIPPLSDRARVRYEKYLPRTVDDYATVSVAARIDLRDDGVIADARLALGAAGAIPLRLPAVEDRLRGADAESLDLRAIGDRVRAAADPVDDVRGSADYKREMAGLWTERALAALIGRDAVA